MSDPSAIWVPSAFGVTSRAARWPAAGHSMQRPRRPLGAAEKNARLNFHRPMPCGKLILPHLLPRPRVDVEIAQQILSANQRRRFARRFLMGRRRHHLEQEDDAAVLTEIGA